MKGDVPCTYFVTVVVFFIMWIMEYSDELTHRVTDMSKSNICTSGLLEGIDNLTLDIEVSMTGDNVTDDRYFDFRALDPADNSTIQLCLLHFKYSCPKSRVNDCCICYKVDNNTYHFQFLCAAHTEVRRKLIVINGERVENVTFPEIYTDEPVSLTINDVPVTDHNSCNIQADLDSYLHLNICASSVNTTRLSLSYQGSVIKSSTELCLNVSLFVNKTSSFFYLRQVDNCNRRLLCLVRGDEQLDTGIHNNVSLPVLPKIILNTSAKARIVAVLCVLMTALVISTFIYCKIRRLYCFEELSNHRFTIQLLFSTSNDVSSVKDSTNTREIQKNSSHSQTV